VVKSILIISLSLSIFFHLPFQFFSSKKWRFRCRRLANTTKSFVGMGEESIMTSKRWRHWVTNLSCLSESFLVLALEVSDLGKLISLRQTRTDIHPKDVPLPLPKGLPSPVYLYRALYFFSWCYLLKLRSTFSHFSWSLILLTSLKCHSLVSPTFWLVRDPWPKIWGGGWSFSKSYQEWETDNEVHLMCTDYSVRSLIHTTSSS
jgi:hypothetical protein